MEELLDSEYKDLVSKNYLGLPIYHMFIIGMFMLIQGGYFGVMGYNITDSISRMQVAFLECTAVMSLVYYFIVIAVALIYDAIVEGIDGLGDVVKYLLYIPLLSTVGTIGMLGFISMTAIPLYLILWYLMGLVLTESSPMIHYSYLLIDYTVLLVGTIGTHLLIYKQLFRENKTSSSSI